MQVTVHAPAKINLTLDIVGVRGDGYHLLESVFQSVSVYDTVVVKKKWGKGITLIADDCDCPVEKNTAYKAAVAFFRYTGIKKGVKITLDKHIPQQAGMGGGSADAAGVLWALNTLFDTRLTLEQLCEIGLKVGADVPFCVVGGTCMCEGRGEILRKLPDMPQCIFVICKPEFPVSTPELFRQIDSVEITRRPDHAAMEQALTAGDLEQVSRNVFNVFDPVVSRDHPEIDEIKSVMADYGAIACQMTGSGSATFGIVDDPLCAVAASGVLKKNYAEIFVCKPV